MEPLELTTILERSGGEWVSAQAPPPVHVAEIGTDSRTLSAQSIFVALRGPRFDGHTYLGEARRRGAIASIVARGRVRDLEPASGPFIAVDDPLEAFERLASWNRRRLGLQVVAVTGSVGKTSTKEFLATTLAGGFQVKSAPKSFNNRIGVATTLLSAHPGTDVLVVELGTSAPGEIAHLSRLAQPHHVVITEIAPAHLNGLKDLDGVIAAKAEIFEGQLPGGGAIVRHGVAGHETFAARARGPLETFGWETGDFAVTSCHRVRLGHDPRVRKGALDHGHVFTINQAENFLLPVPGRHNVLNAAAAIAVARRLGMSWTDIRSALSNCRLPPLRCHVIEEGGVVLFDDSYNANPRSMEAALHEWSSLGGDERSAWRGIAVLGDMLEMGGESRRLHEELGRHVAACQPALLVTVGVESQALGEVCRQEGMAAEVAHFASAREAVPFLKSRIRPGDKVLLKASRGIGLDEVAKALREWLREGAPAAPGTAKAAEARSVGC